MRDTTAQTRFESMSKQSNDSLLAREVVSTAATTEELTLAQEIEALKTSKPKNRVGARKEKRVEKELIQGSTKKQKVEDGKETAELKQKIYKEGKKSYYQIMRADGKSQMYMVFIKMLENFDREDLVDLYKLVKAKFKSTWSVEDLDLLLRDAYDFKLDKKKCRVDTKVFCEILQICLRLPNQDFVEIPSEEEVLSFIKELGYSGNCEMLSTISTGQMHQPWRMFVAVINKYFMYQADNKEMSLARKEHMPYPRFTKVIINNFISKDNTIFMRNRINIHMVCDDTLLGTLMFVFKTKDYQKYGALIPDEMINDDIKLSIAYKTYVDYAIRKVPPKKARKLKKHASPKLKIVPVSPKEPTRRVKKTMRKRKQETYKLQASGSSEGANFESKVPNDLTRKTKDTSEGTGVKPRVLDLFKEDSSDTDDDSWGDNEDESDDVHDEDDNNDDGGNDAGSGNNDDGNNDAEDSEQTDSNDDENPSFTLKDYEEEEQDEEYAHTPKKDKSDDEENMYEEEDDDVAKELADQQNAFHESGFVHEEEDAHVTLTTVHDKTEIAASLSEFELKKILIEKIETNESINRSNIQRKLYIALVESYNTDKDILSTYGDVVTLKRGRDGQDNDEDPIRLRTKKESKSTQAEEPKFEAADIEMQQDQRNESSHIDDQPDNEVATKHDWRGFNLLKDTCKSFTELEYHFEECYKAVNDKLKWNNPEGHAYPFDLSKPLPLIEDQGRQVVPAGYFINNDLEYLKGGSSSSKYATSTTRTKVAKYDNNEGIKDVVPTLWSLVKVAYNKHVIWGTYH
nr:hypothetical protein [Tanacetum cinerariifolium]